MRWGTGAETGVRQPPEKGERRARDGRRREDGSEAARRYREARQLAETDALTGFFNQWYFHETLRREALRAQRFSHAAVGRRLDAIYRECLAER